MTTFNDRERAFETKFAHDEEIRFKVGMATTHDLLQFQEQLRTIRDTPLTAVEAQTYFRWLPPAGLLPLQSGAGASGYDVDIFFTGKTWNKSSAWPEPPFIEGGMLVGLLRDSVKFPPIDLEDDEMVWLYGVRENAMALEADPTTPPYCVFANANLPFFAEPRFDRAHWNYANYV